MQETRPDATETASREELRRRVRRRTTALENVMDTMVDVLLQVGPDGRVTRANDAVHEKLGYDPGDVVGRPVDYVLAAPEDNEQLAAMMTEGELLDRLLSAGHVTDLEVWFETADGEAVPMSLSASVLDDDGFAGIVCVAKDISERVAAQRRAEFLHSLLRHDLGNALQVVGMNLQLAARHDDVPEAVAERVDSAREGVEDATELIEDVRRLHRLDEVAPEPVRLDRAVADAVDRTADLADRREMTVETDVAPVRVAAGPMLRELVANLVENALVHSEGSLVRVTATPEAEATSGSGSSDESTMTDADAGDSPGSDDGSRVTLAVADDGRGVPDELKERVLEEGHTTRADEGGSGMGTYLVERIADSYGATLSVRDADLGGARFEVSLRRARDDGDGNG